MTIGDKIYTPRFCTVTIQDIYSDKLSACEAGYTEPTHYSKDGYTILGKSTGINKMIFAGVKI